MVTLWETLSTTVLDISQTVLAPAISEAVSPWYWAYVPDSYEIANGFTLEIWLNWRMEIG